MLDSQPLRRTPEEGRHLVQADAAACKARCQLCNGCAACGVQVAQSCQRQAQSLEGAACPLLHASRHTPSYSAASCYASSSGGGGVGGSGGPAATSSAPAGKPASRLETAARPAAAVAATAAAMASSSGGAPASFIAQQQASFAAMPLYPKLLGFAGAGVCARAHEAPAGWHA
jgi:hypothetical protein